MPRSIYEKKRAGLPLGTYPDSNREGWAYIGETVSQYISLPDNTPSIRGLNTGTVLDESVWFVSAQAALPDRLTDLTGNGRDAVFGAGSAAPIVLPHDGEDYFHGTGDWPNNRLTKGNVVMQQDARIVARFRLDFNGDTSPHYFGAYTSNQENGALRLRVNGSGSITHNTFNGTSWGNTDVIATGLVEGVWYDLDLTLGATTWSGTLNGQALSGTFDQPRTGVFDGSPTYSAANNGDVAYFRLYLNGSLYLDLDPANVSADYTTVANTGSQGGDWTINRSTTGFKTAVVDRPLTLHTQGRYMLAPSTPASTTTDGLTMVVAFRHYGEWNGDALGGGGAYEMVLDWRGPSTNPAILMQGGAPQFLRSSTGTGNDIGGQQGYGDGQIVYAIRIDPNDVATWSRFDGSGVLQEETTRPNVSDPAHDFMNGQEIAIGLERWSRPPFQGEFIGAAIFSRALSDAETAEASNALIEGDLKWSKIAVWNNVGNNWVQLNALLGPVDYALRDLKHDRVTLEIHDHLNFDYLDYSLTITPAPANWTNPVTIPDDAQGYSITGLAASTTYTVNLVANLVGGGTTEDSIQTFTTPDNPVPLAPLELSSPSRTNSWIDLEWKLPPGSTATTHNIYRGVGTEQPVLVKSGVVGLTARIAPLNQDTKYFYYVTGVNATGLEGPRSNVLKWATGHDETRRSGSGAYHMHPLEFGSWRPDIGWCDWHYWPRRVNQDSIFQGFWIADHRRYYGSITYQTQRCRVEMDQRFGAGVWQNIRIESVSLRRFYRMRAPGNAAAQWMQWYMTSTNIFDWGRPPLIGPAHINNRDDADRVRGHYSMAAGTAIDWLRMPREFAWSLLKGSYMGTAVNGIVLHRGDSENNGYGYAGYGEWCGHGQIDRHINEPWRFSDLSLHFQGSWNFVTQGRVAPYRW